MGPRAGLDRCGKSRPHRDSLPRPSSPWPVAISTELLGPLHRIGNKCFSGYLVKYALYLKFFQTLLCVWWPTASTNDDVTTFKKKIGGGNFNFMKTEIHHRIGETYWLHFQGGR